MSRDAFLEREFEGVRGESTRSSFSSFELLELLADQFRCDRSGFYRFMKLVEETNLTFPQPSSTSSSPSPLGPPILVHWFVLVFSSLPSFSAPLSSPFLLLQPNPSSLLVPLISFSSAGVGRTGSFISIASLLRLLPLHNNPTSSPFPTPTQSSLGPLSKDVRNDPLAIVIDHCREQRLMMVETKEQVDLVWRCTREAAEGRL